MATIRVITGESQRHPEMLGDPIQVSCPWGPRESHFSRVTEKTERPAQSPNGIRRALWSRARSAWPPPREMGPHWASASPPVQRVLALPPLPRLSLSGRISRTRP